MSDGDAELLHDTFAEFRTAANYVVSHASDDSGNIETSKQRLHERTYAEVRERTSIQANLVQAARSRAADALKGVLARWSDGDYASLPTFTADFAEYDKRSATFHEDHVSLSMVDGRVEAEYVLPPDTDGTPFGEYVEADEYEVGGATLHHRDGAFYLHIRTTAEVDEPDPAEHPTVLGVDLGIENVAVTSTGTFWSGGLLNHRREQYEQVRGGLQQTGTESAHKTIESIGDRESRWAEDFLHNLSKEVVAEAVEHGCSVIWAFNQLVEYVKYKAEAVGINVTQVPPQYTSQRCSKCGHTARNNRPTQADFSCQNCGYEVHADYNAAKNVGFKHVRSGQKSPTGRANRQLALKQGALSANGEFSPASGESRDGQSGSSPASSAL
ncbi:transposase [Halobacteriales archaeon SW_12_67_38]|nr:MAG: transposase [Halobacteriales archaeon SW_12_67_38]